MTDSEKIRIGLALVILVFGGCEVRQRYCTTLDGETVRVEANSSYPEMVYERRGSREWPLSQIKSCEWR